MSREDLTKAWREEAELYGLIGAPHSGQAPTPLEDIEDSTSGTFYHYKHGGFYACQGLMALAPHTTAQSTD